MNQPAGKGQERPGGKHKRDSPGRRESDKPIARGGTRRGLGQVLKVGVRQFHHFGGQHHEGQEGLSVCFVGGGRKRDGRWALPRKERKMDLLEPQAGPPGQGKEDRGARTHTHSRAMEGEGGGGIKGPQPRETVPAKATPEEGTLTRRRKRGKRARRVVMVASDRWWRRRRRERCVLRVRGWGA